MEVGVYDYGQGATRKRGAGLSANPS
jgi:hypothetical protein